ncbi:serpin B6-like isoform X2 [Convolutriloba macropyga]|uniref:serpin B6-like isoform X2 n=1 Tax=Convolutriloba macropyga TaxID=536237 RepID=UPI003F5275E6
MSELSYKTVADFGHSLLQYYFEENGTSNCVISPVSEFLCLSMLKRGANGATKSELKRAMCISSDSSGNEAQEVIEVLKEPNDHAFVSPFTLKTANGLFIQKDCEPVSEFVSELRRDFDSIIETVDFKSMDGVSKMNAWVEKETNGKIKRIIDEPDSDTVLAVVSAVYMNGMWDKYFSQGATVKADFHVSKHNTVQVDLMHQTKEFLYIRNHVAKFALAFFPYISMNEHDWSMGILLPDEGLRPNDFLKYLQFDELNQLRSKAEIDLLDVKLPKFRVESSVDLGPIMKLMGVETVFTERADFSGIRCDKRRLKVIASTIQTVKHVMFALCTGSAKQYLHLYLTQSDINNKRIHFLIFS